MHPPCRFFVPASFCHCYMWVQVQESGGAEVRKGIHVNPADEIELSGSKGTANFAMKFDKVRSQQSGRACTVQYLMNNDSARAGVVVHRYVIGYVHFDVSIQRIVLFVNLV